VVEPRPDITLGAPVHPRCAPPGPRGHSAGGEAFEATFAERGFAPAAAACAAPELDAFLARLGPDGDRRLGTRPTSAYLRWRYADVPGFRYYAAWEFDGEHGALLVFRPKAQGRLRELRLCDVLVGRTARSARLARTLVRDVSRRAGADYAAAMAGWGTPEQRVVAVAGFLPAPRTGPIMTVRPLAAGGAAEPLHRRSWRLSIGALELF
jgi:hypothetical protein